MCRVLRLAQAAGSGEFLADAKRARRAEHVTEHDVDPVPMIPSGGTLVSSATQAGATAANGKPMAGPYGAPGGLDGLAGQNGLASPSGQAGQPGPHGQGGFGGQGGFAGQHGQGGFAGQGGFGGQNGPSGLDAVPVHAVSLSGAGDITDRVRVPSSARDAAHQGRAAVTRAARRAGVRRHCWCGGRHLVRARSRGLDGGG